MNYHLIDARCFPADPLDVSARRLLNLSHAMLLEQLMWMEAEDKQPILDLLSGKNDAGADEQDRSARQSAAMIGFDPEAALARVAAAREALSPAQLTGDLQHDYLDPGAPAPEPEP